ncbi:hypothetical protein K2173_014606 [Erythroxylum novogranatense]|uniref:ZF-HD dimerization-type domain-containing protein n=1 Tax=Erythroxylum novogranatense TaxID=1862640 RepID=A0AAV8TH09_9ROSI|nr:hypothetical protein K2173_014606 [Erythroxylum novogranatense]
MEFEDQVEHEEEEQEDEMGLSAPSYDGNSGRVKMTTSPGGENSGMEATRSGGVGKMRYRECLKNHAVGIGGHAVDGCGEFMPAGAEGTLDALKCAACNCHRNFHRQEAADSSAATIGGGDPFFHGHSRSNHHQPPHLPQFVPYYRSPAAYLHVAPPQQRLLALPSTSGGYSREDQEDVSNNPSGGGYGGVGSGGSSRKRFRTKFTPEQKEKMLGLAERLGWRIQKHDEAVVQEFSNETGVKRHVLKVWMHNNKHTLGKKP